MSKNIIENTLSKYKLIEKGDRILVGFSGGADSVCLLHSLWSLKEKYKIEVFAAHVNHGLRGAEADSDERFCEKMCRQMGIEFFCMRADIKKIASETGVSEETAGRNVRYDFFYKLCKEHGFSKIATAHHKNDLAETIVMNFIRGAGINGLSGIPPLRDNIIRPLINTERVEIEKYCSENKLEYVTDKTNFESIYRRNKIRLDLIPYIEREFNSAFVSCIAENAELISYDNSFINEAADKEFEDRVTKTDRGFCISLCDIHKALRLRIFKRMAEECGSCDISAVHLQSIDMLWQKGETGRKCNLPNNIDAFIQYGKLYITKVGEISQEFEYSIEIGRECEIKEAGIRILVCRDDIDGNFNFGENPVLTVRSKKERDIFFPSGMKGRKKVKDYFVNEKIPREDRNKVPILLCNDEIAWIIGKRRDRRFFGKGYRVEIKRN